MSYYNNSTTYSFRSTPPASVKYVSTLSSLENSGRLDDMSSRPSVAPLPPTPSTTTTTTTTTASASACINHHHGNSHRGSSDLASRSFSNMHSPCIANSAATRRDNHEYDRHVSVYYPIMSPYGNSTEHCNNNNEQRNTTINVTRINDNAEPSALSLRSARPASEVTFARNSYGSNNNNNNADTDQLTHQIYSSTEIIDQMGSNKNIYKTILPGKAAGAGSFETSVSASSWVRTKHKLIIFSSQMQIYPLGD